MQPKKWTQIAQRFNNLAHDGDNIKSPKQCRERWFNHLNPDLQKGNWTLDEDIAILEGQRKYGNSWSKIAKNLSGRNENIVKNRWNTLIKRHEKEQGSNDIEELLDLKRKQVENQNNRIVPCPFPILPMLNTADCFTVYGKLCQKETGTPDGSTSGSGDEGVQLNNKLPFPNVNHPVYEIQRIDKDYIQCDKSGTLGIFFPIKDPA